MSQKLRQSGFSLLVFLIILMGFGGVALVGFTQKILKEIKIKEYAHNQEVLQQAKQALLMYAYRYPQFNADGPGRLPCPDDDNDGLIGGGINAVQCQSVGRLPWNDPNLDLYDARDASGERLWYAVSNNFYNFNPGGFSVVNSDTNGTITIVDQTGAILYDGTVAGIAAIIIAPGPTINAQDRSIANADDPDDLVIDTDPGIIDPANYLDAFGGFDNSVFVNTSNLVADAFIRGPVFDPVQNAIVINDQMVIITAQEVIAMAEKATLEVYRNAIDDYLANTGEFPWLYDYNTLNLDAFDSTRTQTGRIPSIFSSYFSDANSQPIESEIRLSVGKSFTIKDDVVPGQVYILSVNEQTSGPVQNVRFTDDDDGHLLSDTVPLLAEDAWFFWNDGDWRLCSGTGRALDQCDQDSSGNPTPGAGNQKNIEVLKVALRIDFNTLVGGLDFQFLPPPPPPAPQSPAFNHIAPLPGAAPGNDARIQATYPINQVVSLPTWPAWIYYQEGDYNAGATVLTGINEDEQLVTDDGDFGDIENQTASPVVIGMRYYPELPAWAHSTQNDWHNSIQMAVSLANQPGGGGVCASPPSPPPGFCLEVNDMVVGTDDITALLVIAGEHDWNDDFAPGLQDDLRDVFEVENANLDRFFTGRTGNDKVLVIQ
jgi:hypothetical protein